MKMATPNNDDYFEWDTNLSAAVTGPDRSQTFLKVAGELVNRCYRSEQTQHRLQKIRENHWQADQPAKYFS